MALGRTYPEDFERLWRTFPKHPTGRSKKEPSFKAFQRVKRDLQFTSEDIDQIILNIEERKKYCVTWQKGNKYGPEMFSTYFNQHRWNEPFERIRGSQHTQSSAPQISEEDNKLLFVQSLLKRGQPVPPEYLRYEEQARRGMEH